MTEELTNQTLRWKGNRDWVMVVLSSVVVVAEVVASEHVFVDNAGTGVVYFTD